MSNNYWLTQTATYEPEVDEDISEIFIDEKDFAKLLSSYWSGSVEAREFGKNIWEYELKTSETEKDFSIITLVNHIMVCDYMCKKSDWVIVCKIVQEHLQIPIYLSNDSDPETCLRITDTSTEDDILLWLDKH